MLCAERAYFAQHRRSFFRVHHMNKGCKPEESSKYGVCAPPLKPMWPTVTKLMHDRPVPMELLAGHRNPLVDHQACDLLAAPPVHDAGLFGVEPQIFVDHNTR